MGEPLSFREFARRDGCSDTLVRRGVKEGRLPSVPGKKVDADYLGTPWRTEAVGAVRAANTANADVRIEPKPDETLEEAAERLIPELLSQFATKADAEKVKETYLALLRKLEYDEKSREVVRVSEVARIVGADYAKVRSKLMEIPSSVAPMAVLMKTPEEIRALIEKEVAHALEELAYDGNLGAVS